MCSKVGIIVALLFGVAIICFNKNAHSFRLNCIGIPPFQYHVKVEQANHDEEKQADGLNIKRRDVLNLFIKSGRKAASAAAIASASWLYLPSLFKKSWSDESSNSIIANAALIQSGPCASGLGDGCDSLSDGNEYIKSLQRRSAEKRDVYAKASSGS